MCEKTDSLSVIDISESGIRNDLPDILDLLLIDRTNSTVDVKVNIIWGNDNYSDIGVYYKSSSQIKKELITGDMEGIIIPRALKSKKDQKIRTKTKAEVFTPTWVVKKQNDEVDNSYREDDIEVYIKRTWLEIACGEAPYMASRYNMETGNIIPLVDRVGFVDRKLKRINLEIDNKVEWARLVEEAYKASYGFEWNGDSLLLARENLLYTYVDYYIDKWSNLPEYDSLRNIANILSYNVFQMDGLKYIIPLSDKKEVFFPEQITLDLFQDSYKKEKKGKVSNERGQRVKIMNWKAGRLEFFDKGVE